MKKVTIVYRFLPQYRVEFYEKLRDRLAEKMISFQLIYGKNKNEDALRKDEVDLPWGIFVPNRMLKFGHAELLWQPCMRYLKDQDLIIVEDANKLLLNYFLLLKKPLSRIKVAFWGHGRNMQLNEDDIRNRYKLKIVKKTDCYFAYTEGVKNYLLKNKYNPEKVFVVQNAIDTEAIKKYYDGITKEEVLEKKRELGITGSKTGIYCGAMYPGKRIDFILKACYEIRKEVEDFHMIFVGSGVDERLVKQASEKHPWIHYVGPKFGKEKVIYFKMADLQLMPSAVGLGILDSFALSTALITTKNPYHGPEIEYLENGKNGIITEDSVGDYAAKIVGIFKNGQFKDLNKGCRDSYKRYTIDAMVDNFTKGIISCLENE